MKNIVILDTETTGLDHTKGQVLEIAAILYHVPSRSVTAQVSTLMPAEENPAYEINRIELEALKNIAGRTQILAVTMLIDMLSSADAIVAHNAEFDKKWIETIPALQEMSMNKKWICTRNDVIWPIRKGVPLNLISICADLGVPIVGAHRALTDCTLLLNAIESVDDIEYFLDRSGKGRIIYHANISYDQRQIVKEAGFQWDNVKKVWFARLTPEIAATMPFTVYPAQNTCPSS